MRQGFPVRQSPLRGPGKEGGFTLLESLIAMALLSVGLLGLASLIITTIQGNAFSRNMTLATDLARDKIEEIRSLPYGSVTDGSDTSNGFSRAWTVSTNSPVSGVKTVTLTVTWTEFTGKVRTAELKTIIGQ